MSRMAGMGFGPASGGPLVEIGISVGTLLAVDDPWRDVVGKMTGVSFMIERELFEGLVARIQRFEFVGKLPRAVTARATDRWRVIDRLVDCRCVVAVVWRGRHISS